MMTKRTWLIIACLGLLAANVTVGRLLWSVGDMVPIKFVSDYRQQFETVTVSSVDDLKRLFKTAGYSWQLLLQGSVPGVVVSNLPPDFANITDVKEKKRLFLMAITPIVMAENQRVRNDRSAVERLVKAGLPAEGSADRRELASLLAPYGLKLEGTTSELILARLDEVPSALVLAQAALETGWGTSRFALEGNSLFGQWTMKVGDGIAPSARAEEDSHEVKAFPSLQASVRDYLRNINTHGAYQELRQARALLRAEGLPLDSAALAAGLARYSERGTDYVDDLTRLLGGKELGLISRLRVADGEAALPKGG